MNNIVKHSFFTFTIVLCINYNLFSQNSSQKTGYPVNAVSITKIEMSPATNSYNISGFRLFINGQVSKDTTPDVNYQYPKLTISFYDNKGKAFKVAPSKTRFKSSTGTVVREIEFKEKLEVFVPFYVFDVQPGTHKMEIQLAVKTGRTKKETIGFSGTKSFRFETNIPKRNSFKVYVREAKVDSLTTRGFQWDARGTLVKSKPDIFFNLAGRYGFLSGSVDVLYKSSVHKDILKTGWFNPSGKIVLSEGDKLTFDFYDDDPWFDDALGATHLTYKEIKQYSDSKAAIPIGQTGKFILEIQDY